MVISVDWKNQREHILILDAAAGLVHDLTTFGFRPVIVVDTFSGDKATRFLKVLGCRQPSPVVRVFALHASDDVLRTRLSGRPEDEFRDFGISRRVNDDTRKFTLAGELVVETSQLSADDVARTILKELGVHIVEAP
jgi:hypothetical protein